MRSLYAFLVALFRRLQDESGQDLVEYALVVALIAFAAILGMNDLAKGINMAFNAISQNVNQYL